MNKDTFIQDWLEGNISPEQMEQYRNDPEYHEVIQDLEHILNASSKLEPPKAKSKSQAWDEFSAKLDETASLPKKKPARVVAFSSYLKVGIAAAIVLIAVIYFLIPRSTVFQAGSGQQLSHNLPDGSKVLLNAVTKISYNESNWDEVRVIELEGEAYFEVVSGKPFVVQTTSGSIEVLGTSFNAYARGQKLKVACFEGSVKVMTGNKEEIVLKKGEHTALENKTWKTPGPFDEKKMATWRSGEFYYTNSPLSEVIAELERQFDIEITIDLTQKRYYSGYFSNKDLEEALKLVFLPMSLNYRQQGSTIIVK